MQVQPDQRQTVAHPPPNAITTAARLPRLLLRRLVYVLVSVLRLLRPVAGALIVGLIALIAISYLGWQLWGPKSTTEGTVTRVTMAAAPAVQNYMEGRKAFDASVMWEAYSTSFQSKQLSTGASKETLQSQANAERAGGLKYGKLDYIGGVKTSDGGGMYFYAVDIVLPTTTVTVSMVITTDAKGKIDGVITPLRSGASN